MESLHPMAFKELVTMTPHRIGLLSLKELRMGVIDDISDFARGPVPRDKAIRGSVAEHDDLVVGLDLLYHFLIRNPRFTDHIITFTFVDSFKHICGPVVRMND
jgi:hypothetical protein